MLKSPQMGDGTRAVDGGDFAPPKAPKPPNLNPSTYFLGVRELRVG